MSTLAARMLEAKRAKQARRNRGESVGNHGLRPLTKAEQREGEPQGHARAVLEIKLGWRHAKSAALSEFRFRMLEIQEPGGILEIPF
jgi:hypothetical protein